MEDSVNLHVSIHHHCYYHNNNNNNNQTKCSTDGCGSLFRDGDPVTPITTTITTIIAATQTDPAIHVIHRENYYQDHQEGDAGHGQDRNKGRRKEK